MLEELLAEVGGEREGAGEGREGGAHEGRDKDKDKDKDNKDKDKRSQPSRAGSGRHMGLVVEAGAGAGKPTPSRGHLKMGAEEGGKGGVPDPVALLESLMAACDGVAGALREARQGGERARGRAAEMVSGWVGLGV